MYNNMYQTFVIIEIFTESYCAIFIDALNMQHRLRQRALLRSHMDENEFNEAKNVFTARCQVIYCNDTLVV